MVMRFIFFLAIIFMAMYNLKANSLDNELKNLSYEKREVLFKIYEDGKKFDLQWTLTAIAWQESSFGKYLVNPNSQDYGIFQINLRIYKNRYKYEIEQANVNDNILIKMLTQHYGIGLTAAIAELQFWKEVRGDHRWNQIWASYNDGNIISKKGVKYSQMIAKKIRALKKYIKG